MSPAKTGFGSDASYTSQQYHITCESETKIHGFRPQLTTPLQRGLSTSHRSSGGDLSAGYNYQPTWGGPPTGEVGDYAVSEEDFHQAANLTLKQLSYRIEALSREQRFARHDPGWSWTLDTKSPVESTLSIWKELTGDSSRGSVQIRKDAEAHLLMVSTAHNQTDAAIAGVEFELVSEPDQCRWAAVLGGDDLHGTLEDILRDISGSPTDLSPNPQQGHGTESS